MNARQKLFCEEYVKDFNAPRAYRVAYPTATTDRAVWTSANRLLKNAEVHAYVEKFQKQLSEKNLITREQIAENLIEVMNRCMQKVPVKEWDRDTKDWAETGEYQFDSKGANTALKLLGDMIGAFTQKVEVKGTVETKVSKLDNIIEELNKEGE